jgi:tRNA nucleotidyltransferase/poly(A) polymerase
MCLNNIMKNWKEFRESRRELAQGYKQALHGVPQDPGHHPEGDALIHSRLVRKAVPRAIQELQVAQTTEGHPLQDILSQVNFRLDEKTTQIVVLAAWLHDIGKSTATTIDGEPWRQGGEGRIQAIGHQDKKHFLPQMQKLQSVAPKETVDLYMQNEELINWLIEHHMDFASGQGFSKRFVAENFDGDKVKDSLRMRLLLILMWSDKMGRRPEDTIMASIGKNVQNLVRSSERGAQRAANIARQKPAFDGGPEQFASMLKTRPMTGIQKTSALKGKFPQLTPEQIQQLLAEGFKSFMNAAEPTRMKTDIPIPSEVFVLDDALRQGDPNVNVKVVGGAVRDWLHGKTPKDYDLTTSLSEKEILHRLRTPYAQSKGIKVAEKESVDTFGVVFAHVAGEKEAIEIAPFRRDVGVADGRRPDRVEQAPIEEDAMRRDLTMNNLYYDFHEKEILDYNPDGQGIKDIKDGVARFVGDPMERIEEDKLRVLRLMRFFSRFNPGRAYDFLDENTLSAIKHYNDLRSHGLTGERIQMEFLAGIKQSQNTAQFLNNYADLGLLESVFPGMDVDVQGIDRLGNSKNEKVILAWLLRNNQNIQSQLNSLKYPSDLGDAIQFLVSALSFDHESAPSIVKARDQKRLTAKSVKPGGGLMSPEEIDSHNDQMAIAMQGDLRELGQVAGDPELAKRMTHLGGDYNQGQWTTQPYQPPVVGGRELMQQINPETGAPFKGPEIGAEQKRRTTDHYRQSYDDLNAIN